MGKLELLWCHSVSAVSVIIYNFNIQGMTCIPLEADPPLLVDADAVLALPITLQRLKLVEHRDREILQIACSIQLLQFHQCTLLDVVRKLLRILPLPDLFGVLIPKGLDHGNPMVTSCVSNVKHYYTTRYRGRIWCISGWNTQFHGTLA